MVGEGEEERIPEVGKKIRKLVQLEYKRRGTYVLMLQSQGERQIEYKKVLSFLYVTQYYSEQTSRTYSCQSFNKSVIVKFIE